MPLNFRPVAVATLISQIGVKQIKAGEARFGRHEVAPGRPRYSIDLTFVVPLA